MPEPAENEVLLQISHCALCRTDAKMWKMGQRDLRLPRILGHEICGISTESGRRFVVWPGRSCKKCELCQNGFENLCKSMQILGFHVDGGLAEYVAVPQDSLIPIPEKLPGDIACLAEPLACTINAMVSSQVLLGDKALVFGAGPVGLLTCLALKVHGSTPYIIDINPERCVQTQQFQDRLGIRCATNFDARDFDVCINAAPSLDTFVKGLDYLKDCGKFCLFSGFGGNDMLSASSLNEIHYRQLKVFGAYGCTRIQMENAIGILVKYQRTIRLLIERHISLKDVPEILPQILESRTMKFVVTF